MLALKGAKKLEDYIDSLAKGRGKVIKSYLAYKLADHVTKELKRNAGIKYKWFTDSLLTLSVVGGVEPSAASVSEPKRVDAQALEKNFFIINIVLNNKAKDIPSDVVKLSKYQWTEYTIPFYPDKKHASLVKRIVNDREFQTVNEGSEAIARSIFHHKVNNMEDFKGTQSLALQEFALRLERGYLGNTPFIFKKSVINAKRIVSALLGQDHVLKKLLLGDYKDAFRPIRKVEDSQMAEIRKFQRRLLL
jgi:hypothetical protein